jgi:hypothetical protein
MLVEVKIQQEKDVVIVEGVNHNYISKGKTREEAIENFKTGFKEVMVMTGRYVQAYAHSFRAIPKAISSDFIHI